MQFSTPNITIPNPELLAKHGLTLEEFNRFFETEDVHYSVCSQASQYYGASIAERNMLSRQTYPQTLADKFLAKYGVTWQDARGKLLDRINNYALEYYNFRKPLGSPNGKNFW